MKYSHKVKFGGKYYPAGSEVPVPEVTAPKETVETVEVVKETAKKTAKKS